jgi:hypothetical protein
MTYLIAMNARLGGCGAAVHELGRKLINLPARRVTKVRFALKADKSLHRSETSRCAINRSSSRERDVLAVSSRETARACAPCVVASSG